MFSTNFRGTGAPPHVAPAKMCPNVGLITSAKALAKPTTLDEMKIMAAQKIPLKFCEGQAPFQKDYGVFPFK